MSSLLHFDFCYLATDRTFMLSTEPAFTLTYAHRELPLKLINSHGHITSSACCCVYCQPASTVNTRSPWQQSQRLTKQGKQEGIPFQSNDCPQCHVDSHQPFPGTVVGFPHLAKTRQLVGGETPPKHVEALITIPKLKKKHKMGLYGCVLLWR